MSSVGGGETVTLGRGSLPLYDGALTLRPIMMVSDGAKIAETASNCLHNITNLRDSVYYVCIYLVVKASHYGDMFICEASRFLLLFIHFIYFFVSIKFYFEILLGKMYSFLVNDILFIL